MTVENGVVEEVIRAIQAIQDPATQNSDRLRYTQVFVYLKTC